MDQSTEGHPHRTEEVWIKAEPIDTEFTSDSNIANHKEFVKNEPESPAEVEFPGTVNIKSENSSDGYECISLSDSVSSQITNDEIQLPTKVKTERLNCDQCEETFASNRNLQIHKQCHQGGKSFPCDECSRSFTQATTLARHKLTHSAKPSSKSNYRAKKPHAEGGSPKDATQPNDQQTQTNGRRLYPCDECEKSFTEPWNLSRHKFFHASKFACDLCDMKFVYKDSLDCHITKHTDGTLPGPDDESRAACESKTTIKRKHKPASISGTNCHDDQRIHADVGRYSCDECRKSFTRKDTFTRHMNTHGEKSFSCDICDKRFTLRRYVVTHMRNHLPARPYSCDECGKTYRQKSNLNSHKSTHSRRPYACKECGKTFAKKGTLKRHRREHSGSERPFACDLCELKFRERKDLNYHRKKHSDATFRKVSCDECEATFTTKRKLQVHKRTHDRIEDEALPFACGLCDEKFTTMQDLNFHGKKHADGMIRCDECGAAFTNKRNFRTHQRIHQGENLFNCDKCDKSFSQSTNLTRHKLTHHSTGTKPLDCDTCDVKFTHEAALKAHTKLGTVCGNKLASKLKQKFATSEQASPATISSNSTGDCIKSEITFGDYEYVIHVMP